MKEQDLLPFLSPKHFRASFELDERTYEVDIETPDLSGYPRFPWGDWGPMYAFELGGVRAVSVTYRFAELSMAEDLWPPCIQLNSPMLYERRRRYPFCLEFEDSERALAFSLYLDGQAQPAKLRVRKVRARQRAAVAMTPHHWRPGDSAPQLSRQACT